MKKTLLILLCLPMIGFGQINFFLDANGGINGLYNSAAIAYSDVDNDGDNDVLITGNFQSQLYINNGIGIFDTSGVPPMFPQANNGSIAFADIDNDGHQDVLITGEYSGLSNSELYRNDGTSYFVLVNGTPFTGVFSGSVAFADIDNDGDEDLLITGDVGANDFIGLYKNDGAGNFTEIPGISLCGSIEGGVNFLDFDGDSDLDLIITGLTYNCSSGIGARTILYENDGTGIFTEDPSHPFWSAESSSTSFGDIDGDNDMDIIVSGWDGAGASFTNLGINDGVGNFTLVTGGGGIVEVRNSSVTFADLDNDSDQDLIISGEDNMGQNQTLVYSNDGTGNFTEVQNLNLVAPTNPAFVSVDIDGDADLDLIIVGDNSTSVYINAPGVYGCTDSLATNYDPLANINDSSCTYLMTYLPDDNFEQALINLGYDNILDDYVTTASIDTITILNVESDNISDLTGIEDFSLLEHLECQGNSISSLDLSANVALTTLYCNGNNIMTLDLSQNIALTALYCGQNQLLTSLDLSYNSTLTTLNCSSGQFTSLDVSQNTALTYLDCGNNQLTSLDVSYNPSLILLHCDYNNLYSLDLRNGNNHNFDGSQWMMNPMNSTWNPNLYCIDVDSIAYGNWQTDAWTSFSTNCATALGCTDTLACNYDSLATVDDGSCGYSTSSIHTQVHCDTYTWLDAVTYTASNNTATHTVTNAVGCDSTVTLDLTINNSTISTDIQVHCDSYTWINGVTYTASNNSTTFTSTNAAGCDNVATLDLTIKSSTSSTDFQSSCDNYTWIDGITYTVSNNTATSTLTNSVGCDSIILLNLIINNSSATQISQFGADLQINASGGNLPFTYIWNTSATTQTITPTVNGWYWCVVTDANGCIGDTSFYEVTNIVSAINETTNPDRKLLRITDMLGQETPYRKNTPLFYIYDDGTVEKRIVIE